MSIEQTASCQRGEGWELGEKGEEPSPVWLRWLDIVPESERGLVDLEGAYERQSIGFSLSH